VALGLACPVTTYEGQTAIRLEAAARRYTGGARLPSLPFRTVERDGMLWIDWSAAFSVLLDDPARQAFHADAWARAAHEAVSEAALQMASYGAGRTGFREIALSGGVFMNRILTERLAARLKAVGLKVRLHRTTPPNDGCIALGQAVVAGNAPSAMGAP
jgi:hydrogenase maturation protein HypF